jgi:hypothetical protein
MVGHSDFEALEAIFEHIAETVADEEDGQSARDIFREWIGTDSGEITALDSPEVYRRSESELVQYRGRFDSWYGIDASTVRPQDFQNGLITSAATAICAMLGDGDTAIEAERSIVGAVYCDIDGVEFSEQELQAGDVMVELETVRATVSPRELRRWVGATARVPAECRHSERVADRIDGPLFLDGSLYPMSVLPNVQFARAINQQRSTSQLVETEQLGTAAKAIQSRVNAIGTLMERDLPVVGIVKTISTSRVVDALRQKVRTSENPPLLPWAEDSQFLADVLYHDEPRQFSFTSWLVRTHRDPGARGEQVEPLGGFDIPAGYEPADFRRAFFFVRLPRGIVFRVEAPYGQVDTPSKRAEMQMFALGAIAEANGAPMVVDRADELARVPNDVRDYLTDVLDITEPVQDYNRDERFDFDFDSNDTHYA